MDHGLLAEALSIVIALRSSGLINFDWFFIREPHGIWRQHLLSFLVMPVRELKEFLQCLLQPQVTGIIDVLLREDRGGPKWSALQGSLETLRSLWTQLRLHGFKNLPFLRRGGQLHLSCVERERLAQANRSTGGFEPWYNDLPLDLDQVVAALEGPLQQAESCAQLFIIPSAYPPEGETYE